MRSPLSRVPLVFLLGSGLALLSPQTARAQTALVGHWGLVADSVTGLIPGLPPPPELDIAAAGDQIRVKKGKTPLETYRTDGSETDLEGYRKGVMAFTDGELTLTTTRVRPGSETITIVTDHYVLAGSELLVHRTLRVERPRGVLVDTPQSRWEARYIQQ